MSTEPGAGHYALLRDPLETELFLGTAYEDLFDQFEVMASFVYADWAFDNRGSVWAPLGRFAWKYSRSNGGDPFTRLIKDAEVKGNAWPILKAGFFRGSADRFAEITKGFISFLASINW